jgi:hypothetical protein
VKAAGLGYRWAALEYDDYGNDQIWGPFRLSCHAAGLQAGVWMTEGANIRITPSDADFAIAEMEGPGDYEGVVSAISGGAIPACPKAIVTNFNLPLVDASGPNPQACKPLIQAGFACLTEAYMGDNPRATPPNMDFMGRNCGWLSTSPVFGLYNAPMTTYDQYKSAFPGWSSYLAEYVL